jgi:AcrR family transcriptional regulator
MARTKSEQKRSDIIRVAAELFEKLGYDRTSMNMVAEGVGGSKQTLYNHFRSKDELLRAVLDQDVGQGIETIIDAFRAEKAVRKALVSLGTAYLERRLSSQAIANIRIVANQPDGANLGREFWDDVLRPAAERIAALFKQLIDRGELIRSDPWKMTMMWKGMIEQDLFERRLLGAMPKVDPSEIEAAAKAATDAFLKLYRKDARRPVQA